MEESIKLNNSNDKMSESPSIIKKDFKQNYFLLKHSMNDAKI
jgi:hypothetical protein